MTIYFFTRKLWRGPWLRVSIYSKVLTWAMVDSLFLLESFDVGHGWQSIFTRKFWRGPRFTVYFTQKFCHGPWLKVCFYSKVLTRPWWRVSFTLKFWRGPWLTEYFYSNVLNRPWLTVYFYSKFWLGPCWRVSFSSKVLTWAMAGFLLNSKVFAWAMVDSLFLLVCPWLTVYFTQKLYYGPWLRFFLLSFFTKLCTFYSAPILAYLRPVEGRRIERKPRSMPIRRQMKKVVKSKGVKTWIDDLGSNPSTQKSSQDNNNGHLPSLTSFYFSVHRRYCKGSA